MKRTAKELTEYLSGTKLDDKYLLEVTGVFYDLTIEEFYQGKDHDVFVNYLYDHVTGGNGKEKPTKEDFKKMRIGDVLVMESEDISSELLKEPRDFLLLLLHGIKPA